VWSAGTPTNDEKLLGAEPTMHDSTQGTIEEFISLRFPNYDYQPAEDIFSLGFINSLFAMELVMFIERTFQIEVENSDLRLDNFRSIETMGKLVDLYLNASGSPI
jgi:methoxymalonate biosynthesis acyl carrier protein